MSSQTTKWMASIGVCMTLIFAAPTAAVACSIMFAHQDMEMASEEPEAEAEFPEPVVLEINEVKRAEPRASEARPQASCDDVGWLRIAIEGYDRGWGLQFEVEGEYPESLRVDEGPFVFEEGLHIFMVVWGDEGTHEEAIDIRLSARWVDEYGRQGPASEPLHIHSEGMAAVPSTAEFMRRMGLWWWED